MFSPICNKGEGICPLLLTFLLFPDVVSVFIFYYDWFAVNILSFTKICRLPL